MKKAKHTPLKAEPVKMVTPKTEAPRTITIKAEAPKPIVPKPQPASLNSGQAEPAKIGRVSFELVKPEAKSVYVAGSFNDWKPEKAPMMPVGNGRWVGDLSVKPGRYEYLFVVDGQWIPDPNAKESVQNPFGGRNSILGVSD